MSEQALTIYVVRHGETDENAKGILCGQLIDSPINNKGRHQAQMTASDLSKMDFDAIYASDMQRAQQTAQIISAALGKPVIGDERLRERDYGSLSGKTWIENFGEMADEMRRRDINQLYDYRPYGGESAEEVRGRLLDFLNELKQQSFKHVVIVAHGGVLKALQKHFAGEAFDTTPTNGSVYSYVI